MTDTVDTATTASSALALAAISQAPLLAETSEARDQTAVLPLPDEPPEELPIVIDESIPQDKRDPIRVLSFRGF